MTKEQIEKAAEKYADSCDNESGAFFSRQLKAIRAKAYIAGENHVLAKLEEAGVIEALADGCKCEWSDIGDNGYVIGDECACCKALAKWKGER